MRNFKSVLFATDLYLTGSEALDVATRLAELFGARLHLFHVIKRHSQLPLADLPLIERATAELGQLRDQLMERGIEATIVPVEFGSPADAIVRQAEKLDVDLIVMGCGHHLPGSSAAGSIVEGVIQRARQPVLAVHATTTRESFTKILCPVDHSTTSRRGLNNAVRLAQALGSRLIVLSVVPDVSWLAAAIEAGEFADVMGKHDRQWRESFESFLRTVEFGDVPWSAEVRSGSPAEQIVQVAQDRQAGLIVMGAIGQTGLIKAILGSVTRGVLKRLPTSILVIKHEDLVEEFTEEDARTVELLFAEGEALLESDSFEAAVAKYDQVLAHNPFHEPALLRRAEALDRIGRADAAARSRRRAIAIRSSVPAVPSAS